MPSAEVFLPPSQVGFPIILQYPLLVNTLFKKIFIFLAIRRNNRLIKHFLSVFLCKMTKNGITTTFFAPDIPPQKTHQKASPTKNTARNTNPSGHPSHLSDRNRTLPRYTHTKLSHRACALYNYVHAIYN